MTFGITIFFISLLSTLGIIGNKIKENETGNAFVSFHRGADDTLHRFGKRVRGFVKHAPREMARLIVYFLVHKAVLVYEKLKEELNNDVQEILNSCLKEVEDLLRKESQLLDRFAQELLAKDELNYDEIEAVFKEFNKIRPSIS